VDLSFNNTQEREEIKKALSHYINSNAIPVHISLPAALIYGESGEARVMFCYHPDKLGDAIFDVMHAAKGIHDWKTSVYFDRALGMAMVWFTTKDNVGIPELFLNAPVGTA
jgi:hypothetical protein